jgi:SAM-dependent methyltransferase
VRTHRTHDLRKDTNHHEDHDLAGAAAALAVMALVVVGPGEDDNPRRDPHAGQRSAMIARSRPRGLALTAGAAVLAAALWWRRHPSACPYGQRFWVEAPHPLITRERLREVLEPQAGERMLEVGPGTGYYTLDAANSVTPGGQLDIFDLQQEMLDHTMRRAGERGLTNVTPTQGDARDLPYPSATFDAAFLVTVLGEVPDQDAALRELARVLRPGGRLVVGELFGDPHWVSPSQLRRRAEAAGLTFNRRSGTPLGYFARFERTRPAGRHQEP